MTIYVETIEGQAYVTIEDATVRQRTEVCLTPDALRALIAELETALATVEGDPHE